MFRCAARGAIWTSSANAAPYSTRLEAIWTTTSATTKLITSGATAQLTRAAAATAEPAVMIRPAPKRSIQLPSQGAVRPPASSAAESAPNIHSVGHDKSFAMPAARMEKL
jgi:hypothetical protein